jgi:hypothetical protein
MQINLIDNTLLLDNHRYDMYWNIGSIPMLAYTEGGHKVDWDLHYVANMQANNIEFFESWRSVQLTNGTLTSGFGTISAAASALQLTNISANEVCQFIAPTDVSARGDGSIANLILARDTTSPTLCAGNTDVMMDLTSNFALWKIMNLRSGDLQTVASIGPSSTLQITGASIPAYSFFSAGANAFKVSAGAELVLNGISARDILPAGGGGTVIGCGADSTCGGSQAIPIGFTGEGGLLLSPSGDTTHTGTIQWMRSDGVTRNGYCGAGSASGEINCVSDHGNFVINGNGGQVNINSSGGATRMAIVNKLPTSCSGLASGDLWMDTSISNTVKVCP